MRIQTRPKVYLTDQHRDTTRMSPRLAHDLLKDAKQGDVDFKLFKINLLGLLRKLDYVIGLGLFYCNRLGLDACLYPLPYIKRGTVHPFVDIQSYQSIQRKRQLVEWT
jgi:hypothetical protein